MQLKCPRAPCAELTLELGWTMVAVHSVVERSLVDNYPVRSCQDRRTMTWHTSAGDRYLIGAEAQLFRAAMRETLRALDADDLDCTDTLLDLETTTSRLHLFALVAKYLLRPTLDLAPLNAWTEGAVGIVFACLANRLDEELDPTAPPETATFYWRDQILSAARERGWRGEAEHEAEHDSVERDSVEREPLDAVAWHHRLEFLEEQILWDLDWAVDPFGPLASLVDEGEDSYFHWQHRSEFNTPASLELLGELCGYRRGQPDCDDAE